MVETVRFEPTSPKEQIYSLPHPSNCAVSPYISLVLSCLFANKGASSGERLAVILGSVPRTVGPA
jgi:hypothetical protein